MRSFTPLFLLTLTSSLCAQSSEYSPRGLNLGAVEGNAGFSNWGPERRFQQVDGTWANSGAKVLKALSFRRDGMAAASTTYAARTMDLEVTLAHTDYALLSTTFASNYKGASNVNVYTLKSTSFPDWTAAVPVPPAAFNFLMVFDVPFAFNGTDGLCWDVHYLNSTNTNLAIMDRHYFAVSAGVASNSGTTVGTGCIATGQTAAYLLSVSYQNKGSTVGMTIRPSASRGPASAATVLHLDAVNQNLTVPFLCGTVIAFPLVSIPAGTTTASGSLTAFDVNLAYAPNLIGIDIYNQLASIDVGQPGTLLPVALSNGNRNSMPPIILCAYAWASGNPASASVFPGGGAVVRIDY